MVQDRDIVSMNHEQEVIHALSNRDAPDCKFYYPAGTG